MQLYYPPKPIATIYHWGMRHCPADQTPRGKYEELVQLWESLKQAGVADSLCQQATKISRATYYRYKQAVKSGKYDRCIKRTWKTRERQWSKEDERLVRKLRRENPSFGKGKLHYLLKRDHGFVRSESTVGRILKQLQSKEAGLVRSKSAFRRRRSREFNGYAKRRKYGMTSRDIGEMVQIDHMSVTKNQLHVKHFMAWDPHSKYLFAKLSTRATSRTAREFLYALLEAAPFKIKSIQVDGGSEFMRHFEDACESEGIALYVNPPKRPKWNGGIERANRTLREEFYAMPSLANTTRELEQALQKAIHKYNTYRPHHALAMKTPKEYINEHLSETHNLSQLT